MISLVCCFAACVSPEGAAEHRQAVECAARNPCKHGKRISNPDGVTEFCRAFGTYKMFAFLAGVPFRFATLHPCLYSVQAFGLDLRSSLLILGIVDASIALPSLNRGLRGSPPFGGAGGGPQRWRATPLLWRRLGSLEQPSIWLRPHKGEQIPHLRRRSRGRLFLTEGVMGGSLQI